MFWILLYLSSVAMMLNCYIEHTDKCLKSIESAMKNNSNNEENKNVKRARIRMLRRNCIAGPVCLNWALPTKYIKLL